MGNEPCRYAIVLAGAAALSLCVAAGVRAEAPMAPVHAIPVPAQPPGPAASQTGAAAASAAKPDTGPANGAGNKASAAPASGPAEPQPAAASAPAEPREASREPAGRGGVKPGLWQFTAHLLAASAAALPQEIQPKAAATSDAAGGISAHYTSCLSPDNAIPAEFGRQCTLDRRDRNGQVITWTMSCAATHVHIDGTARYHGDTMEATVLSHLAATAGKATTLTQHIAGRYLGACPPQAALQPPGNTTAETAKPAPAPSKADAATAKPPPAAASEAKVPAAANADSAGAAEKKAEAEPPPAEHNRRAAHRHEARHVERHYYAHGGRGWSYGGADRGASFGGPAPYSNSGL